MALEAEIQKSITLELLHNSLTTALEEQDFPTAMELKAELQTVLANSSNSSNSNNNNNNSNTKADAKANANANASASKGSADSKALANTSPPSSKGNAPKPTTYAPKSARATTDAMVQQLDARDVALGMQQEQATCAQCDRQQEALDVLNADRAAASKDRQNRWKELRALRAALKQHLADVSRGLVGTVTGVSVHCVLRGC